jgi:hypothetical protein
MKFNSGPLNSHAGFDRPGLEEIALESGFSVMTCSRVLRGAEKGRASKETSRRIWSVARRFGFQCAECGGANPFSVIVIDGPEVKRFCDGKCLVKHVKKNWE